MYLLVFFFLIIAKQGKIENSVSIISSEDLVDQVVEYNVHRMPETTKLTGWL